jgi:hypothetical protein
LTTPDSKPVCITCDYDAADTDPRYSPTDENILVYLAQSVPGCGADQCKAKLYNGKFHFCLIKLSLILSLSVLLDSNLKTTLLDNWDRSIQAIIWSADGQSLFFEIDEEARHVIYEYSNILSSTSAPNRLISTGSSHDINIHPTNTKTFVFTHESITEPTNIYLYSSPTNINETYN